MNQYQEAGEVGLKQKATSFILETIVNLSCQSIRHGLKFGLMTFYGNVDE